MEQEVHTALNNFSTVQIITFTQNVLGVVIDDNETINQLREFIRECAVDYVGTQQDILNY